MSIKIVIVDDHELYRTGIHTFLSKDPSIEILGEASCDKELFRLLDNGVRPDILLLDIILPGQKGTDIARIVKHIYPDIKIVMLSSETSEDLIVELSEIGINGFISKASQREELILAIQSVADDIPYFGKDIAKTMYDIYICKIGSHPQKKKREEQDLVFTEKECKAKKLPTSFVSAQEPLKRTGETSSINWV